MKFNLRKKIITKPKNLVSIFTGTVLIFSNASCFAAIVLHGNQVINSPTAYNGVTLDLTDGRFTINTGGALNIQNSIINITVSPSNPFFVQMNNGNLALNNNKVNVKVSGIPQNSDTNASYQLVSVQQGSVNVINNAFVIDTPFTVGLFGTQGVSQTSGFKIDNNTISNFHGGVYLINSNHADVSGNEFTNVSFSNIYNNGNLSTFNGNTFIFPGNLKSGNAFDVVNSDSMTISNNIITSGSNYGINIMGGNNIFVENNKITDGNSYAINIQTPSLNEINKDKHLTQLMQIKKIKFTLANDNIVISGNYIAQNKYGLTGGMINRLLVTKNIFIQKFTDSSIRQFWTNNDNLLPLVTNLTWLNNVYKEAFTQENGGDNTPALQFVEFPAHGGVFIN